MNRAPFHPPAGRDFLEVVGIWLVIAATVLTVFVVIGAVVFDVFF